MNCLNVFQIYLSDADEIPPGVRACMQSVRAATPGYQYRLYDLASLRSFIQEHFPPDVLHAYDALRPYAYRADLGRYCLLHKFGGWYIDSTVMLQSDLPDPGDHDHVVFEDAPRPDRRPNDANNGLLYARPETKLMELAIALIVENCRQKNYGEGPLDPTGPALLGRALTECSVDPLALTGRYLPLTPDHPRKNFAFILPEGRILAWGKATHGTAAGDGLAAFQARGTNSYNMLWNRGLVYIPAEPEGPWVLLSGKIRAALRRAVRSLRMMGR